MVMQPPNACATCNGTHWVLDIGSTETDDEGFPLDLVEKPCPTCNPYGMRPKVQY